MDATIAFDIEDKSPSTDSEIGADVLQNDWLNNDSADVLFGRTPNPVKDESNQQYSAAKLKIRFHAGRYQLLNDEQIIPLEDGDCIELPTHIVRVKIFYPPASIQQPKQNLFETPLAAPPVQKQPESYQPINTNFDNFSSPTDDSDPLGFLYGSAGANQPPRTPQRSLLGDSRQLYPHTSLTSHISAPGITPQIQQQAPSEGNILRDLGINEELASISQQASPDHHRQTVATQAPLDHASELLDSNQNDLLDQYKQEHKSQLNDYQPYQADFAYETESDQREDKARDLGVMEKLQVFKQKILSFPAFYKEYMNNEKNRR